MSETVKQVASIGAPQRIEFKLPMDNGQFNGHNTEAIVEKVNGQEGENRDNKNVDSKTEGNVSFTDEQRKAFLKELFGDENTDVEAIKEKIKPVIALPTDEQKKKDAENKELKLLELFIKKGGKLDQFQEIKTLANADIKELSKKDAIQEYVTAGFSEEEAKEMVKQRYYQVELANIEQDVDNDESDDDFEKRKTALQKKIDFGSKKLETKSSHKIQQAAGILKSLQDAYDSEILLQQSEQKNATNVDALLKDLPRKVTYQLGEVNNQLILPIEHEVSEESISKVAAILKDPAQRNNIFNNQDGTLNLPKITDVLLKNFEYERSLKNAYLEGSTRQEAEFEKVFPARSAYELGVGGSVNKSINKGQVASTGKVQKVSPQHN